MSFRIRYTIVPRINGLNFLLFIKFECFSSPGNQRSAAEANVDMAHLSKLFQNGVHKSNEGTAA